MKPTLPTMMMALALGGCGYRPTVVEVSPNTYAMDPYAFHCLLVKRHATAPEVWIGAQLQGSSDHMNPNGDPMVQEVGDVNGIFFSRDKLIAIKARDPHHLTYRNELCLVHERGHREDDYMHPGDEGASPEWAYLATVPGGQEYLTHPEINAKLRKEGYEAPR
jgi:hypothetical protein